MSETFLVATKKGLFTVRQGREKRWAISRRQFLGDHTALVSSDPRSGWWYVCFEHGHFGPKILRSKNEGETWEEISKPEYPPKPEGVKDVDPMRGTDIPWSVQRVWALECGTVRTPGRLWLGCIPGGLFRSDDGGDSWELVRSLWDHPDRKRWMGGGADLPGIHSICVDPSDDKHVLVAVSCGGVWRTRDEGRSWSVSSKGLIARFLPPEQQGDEVLQDPHRMVQCDARPEVLWIQHHNGIFHSTDNAKSWHEIPHAGPSTFGFGVAAHPKDGNTAWFIPAQKDEHRIPVGGRVVVTRTRDGGRTFEELRSGLPQQDAYDLVYRHAFDVDESGERLAFGSTTGSLYASNDGGDGWQCIGEHLPPVDAVRFV